MPTTSEFSERNDLGSNVEVLTTENERLRGILDTFGINATVVLMDMPKQSQKQAEVSRTQDQKISSTIIKRDNLICLRGCAPKEVASTLDLRFTDKAIVTKAMSSSDIVGQRTVENEIPRDLIPWEDESPPISSSANVCSLDGDNESGWDSGNMLSTFEKANPGKTSYLGMEQYTNVEVPVDLPEVKVREISELVDSIVPTDDDFREDDTRTEEQKFAAVDRPIKATEPAVQSSLAMVGINTSNANGSVRRRPRYPRNAGGPPGSMRYSARYNHGGSPGGSQSNGSNVRAERAVYPFAGYSSGGDIGSQSARSSPYPRRGQPTRPAYSANAHQQPRPPNRPFIRQGTASWRYSRNRYRGHPSLPIEVARVNNQLHGSPSATYYYNQTTRLGAPNHYSVNTSSASDPNNYTQSFPIPGNDKTTVSSSTSVDSSKSTTLQSSHLKKKSQPLLPDPPSEYSMSQHPNNPPNPLPIIAAAPGPRPRGVAVNLSAIGTNTQFPATVMGPFAVAPLLHALPGNFPSGSVAPINQGFPGTQPTRFVSLQFPLSHDYQQPMIQPQRPLLQASQQNEVVPPNLSRESNDPTHTPTSGVDERTQYQAHMYPESRSGDGNSALLTNPSSGTCVAATMENLRPLVSPGAPPRKVVENPFASGPREDPQEAQEQADSGEIDEISEDDDAAELARRTFVITTGEHTTTTVYGTPTNLVQLLGEADKTIPLDSIDPNLVIDDSFELPPHLEAQRATAACTKPYAFNATSKARLAVNESQRLQQPPFQQFHHLSSPQSFQNQQLTSVLQASNFQQNFAAIPSFASAQGLPYSPTYYIVNPVAFSPANNPAASLIAPAASPATALYQSGSIMPPYPFCGYPSNQPSFNILPLTSSFPSAQAAAAALLMNNPAATGAFLTDHHHPLYQGQQQCMVNGHLPPFRHPQHYGTSHDPMAGGSLRRTRYPTANNPHHAPRRYSENISRPAAPNTIIRRGDTAPTDSQQPNRAVRVNSSSTTTDPEPVRNASESKQPKLNAPSSNAPTPVSQGSQPDRRRPTSFMDNERNSPVQGDHRRGYNRRMGSGNQYHPSASSGSQYYQGTSSGSQADRYIPVRGSTHVDSRMTPVSTAQDTEQNRFHGVPARRGYYSSSRGGGAQERRGKPHHPAPSDPNRPR